MSRSKLWLRLYEERLTTLLKAGINFYKATDATVVFAPKMEAEIIADYYDMKE